MRFTLFKATRRYVQRVDDFANTIDIPKPRVGEIGLRSIMQSV